MHTIRRSKTVLVIDDNPGIRGYLEAALTRFGYGVLTAHTGHEGLAVAGEQVVDAILLDLAMPDQSGLAVLHELKRQERTRNIPVLLVSGFASLVPPQRVQEATAVIQKPFRLGDLLAQLERALG